MLDVRTEKWYDEYMKHALLSDMHSDIFDSRGVKLADVRAAFVRGSRLIADNIGADLPEWSSFDDDQATGRKLLVAFDDYADKAGIETKDAATIRDAIKEQWGLSGERHRVTVGDVMARYG